MHRLTALSLRQRSVVVLVTIVIAFAGVFSVTQLQEELLPNLELPIVTVITAYPGAGPADVDSRVSMPISQSLSGITGVDEIQTTSNEGVSVVVAQSPLART